MTSLLLVQTFVTSHEGHTPLRIHLQVTSDAERLEQKHHVQSKHVSRHVSKTYPLTLTERSEATEATEARQNITNWQIISTKFKEWNYCHIISQFLAQGRMVSCEGHTFVDDSLSDFTRCGTIFTCSSLPSIPMYPYSPTALSSMYTSLQCCSSQLEEVIQV